MTISNSTISENSATQNGGGIDFLLKNEGAADIFLFDSIVDGNTAGIGTGDLYISGPGAVDPGSSYNLVGSSSDTADLTINHHNLLGVTAELDPLSLIPLAGSPALNAGSTANAPATDVYGNQRTFNGTIDIGAAGHIVTWSGAAGDDKWDTPGNWTVDEVPTAADVVIIDIANPAGVTISRPGTTRLVASRATCDRGGRQL